VAAGGCPRRRSCGGRWWHRFTGTVAGGDRGDGRCRNERATPDDHRGVVVADAGVHGDRGFTCVDSAGACHHHTTGHPVVHDAAG
jgi:hypothetical protein